MEHDPAAQGWAVPAFDAVPAGLLIADGDLVLRYQNDYTRRLNGRDSLLQVGTSLSAYVRTVYSGPAAETLLACFARAIADGEAGHLRTWSLTDRTQAPADRQLDLHAQRWIGPGGAHGLLLTLSDVSEHARAVQAARRAEARYRALVAATAQIVWSADAAGRVVEDLPGWRALTGQAPDAIAGDGWMDAILPEDRQRVEAAWRHSVAAGAPQEIRFRVRDGAGRQRGLLAHIVPVLDDGQRVCAWIGTCTEVTATGGALGAPDPGAGRDWAKVRGDRLEALVEGMPQMVWTAAPNGELDYASRVWTAYTGLPMTAALGAGWAGSVHPDDVPAAAARWAHSLATGEIYEQKFRLHREDGAYRWFLARAWPQRQPDGRIIHWLGTCTDVHDQVMAEDRYRSLAEGAEHVIWTSDTAHGNLKYLNASWSRLTGQDLDEARTAWREAVHADDLAAMGAAARTADERGEPWRHEHRLRVRDGSHRWQQTRAWPLRDASGQIVEWQGVTIDIDERRLAEDRLRFLNRATVLMASSLAYEETLVQVAQLAVPGIADWCAIDLVGDGAGGGLQRLAVAHVDPDRIALAMELQRDYPPRPGSPATTVIESGIGDIIEEVPEAALTAFARDERHLDLLRRLGLSSCAIMPLRVRDRTIGLLTVAQAESRRRFSARDRQFLEDLAQRIASAVDTAILFRAEANRASELGRRNLELDRFASSAAHDMQSPLRTVVSYLGLLELRAQDALPPAARGWIRTASEAAVRMRNVIDALLDYARGGHITARDLSPVPVAEAVGEALANLETAIAEASAAIEVDDLPVIRGSRTHLVMLFQNLVSNALKFRDRGRPLRIAISGARTEDGWEVLVRDNGQGVPADCRDRLFTLFERFHPEESGSGIGLATCKRIVQLHAGTIALVEPPDGIGATFRVVFPA